MRFKWMEGSWSLALSLHWYYGGNSRVSSDCELANSLDPSFRWDDAGNFMAASTTTAIPAFAEIAPVVLQRPNNDRHPSCRKDGAWTLAAAQQRPSSQLSQRRRLDSCSGPNNDRHSSSRRDGDWTRAEVPITTVIPAKAGIHGLSFFA